MVLPVAAVLLALTATTTRALSQSATPVATPAAVDSPTPDPGLILVIVVIPVVLLALIWMGYIFWLIFHEGENVGSGDPAPHDNGKQRPPSGS
jgi:hypothetical protein